MVRAGAVVPDFIQHASGIFRVIILLDFMKRWRASRFFIYSATVVFVLTASAKILSAIFGPPRLLKTQHEIFTMLDIRQFLLATAALELAVVWFLVKAKSPNLKLGAVAWFSTILVLYRFLRAEWYVPGPCRCLGNLGDWLHVSPVVVDDILKATLGYLCLISYLLLFLNYVSTSRF